MPVYAVLGVYDGVPTGVEVFADRESARARGFELAREFDLFEMPPDWQPVYGEWNPERGSGRFWQHHWYDNQRDVVVAECDVR